MDKKEGARAIGGVEEDYADHFGGAIVNLWPGDGARLRLNVDQNER